MGLSLKVYNSSKKDNALNDSLLGISNGFNIRLANNAFYTYNQQYWKMTTVHGFTGIMLENLSLNFQTNWGDAGGAVLGSSIANMLNSKFLKILASQEEEGFKPFICSDAWTQQKVSGEAQPVKAQIKFKAYNLNRMGCTNYNDVLRFLILICSPLKSATGNNDTSPGIGSHLFSTLNAAAAGGSNIIGTVADSVSNLWNSDNSNITKVAKNIVETVDSTYNRVVSETGNGKNNANFTVDFCLGDILDFSSKKDKNLNKSKFVKKINTTSIESVYYDSKHQKTKNNFNIDWIITSFNFKPSMQFEMVKEDGKELPKPLWMDFDVTLETRMSLSNKYVYQVIVPQILNDSEENG